MLQTGELNRVGSAKTRSVDVRVLSATNAPLAALIADGRFREDLLYRLNTVEIELPPLRRRTEDIADLARHFLRRQATRYGKDIDDFEPDALRSMRQHSWPGNVRELEHAVERAVLMARGRLVCADDLGLRAGVATRSRLEDLTLAEAERHLIEAALERCGGNVEEAAARLGLSRSALYRRLKRHRK